MEKIVKELITQVEKLQKDVDKNSKQISELIIIFKKVIDKLV